MSEEEFINLPDTPCKLLDGELIELPPAKLYHSVIARKLMYLLATALGESRVWILSVYWLREGRWLIPDVSVSWPDQGISRGWYQGSPMIAIEIASRGNTAWELESKTALYLEDGAAEVWVLYPKTQTIVVSRKQDVLRVAPGGSYYCELLNLTIVSDFCAPDEG
jgi:Uma2 family endonuclease